MKNKKIINIILLLMLISTTILLLFKENNNVFENIILILFIIILITNIKLIKNIEEPLFLFSVYTLSIPLIIIYSNFFNHISNWRYSIEYDSIYFHKSLIFILLSLILLSIGYYVTPIYSTFKIPTMKEKKAIYYISNFFIMMGILNFIFNFITQSEGFEIFYKFNYFAAKLKENNSSSLGYSSLYPIGVYLKSYLNAYENKKNYFFIILGTIFLITTGRITRTLMFIITNIFIYNTYERNISKKYFFKSLTILCVVGILFYYVRILTSYIHYEKVPPIIDELSMLLKKVVENGNLPNLPVLQQIFKYFKTNNFLDGETFLAIFYPGKSAAFYVRDNIYNLASNKGSLPPTMYGEFYMNFGYIKSLILMFILGGFYKILYYIYNNSKNIFIKLIYLNILVSYILVSSKGTISNISFFNIGLLLFTGISVKIINLCFICIKIKRE